MRLTVKLLLAALVLAGHVVPAARGDDDVLHHDKDALTKSTTMPVEAQRSVKLAPNKRGDDSALDHGKLANADTTVVDLDQQADLTDDAVDNIKVVVEESFNLAASDAKSYMAFLADLDFHVNATAARLLNLHPVLGRQQLRDPPPTWFKLTLTGDDDDRVDFFMRSDNLYITAFANKYGTRFAFQPQGNQYRMPGSTFLDFGSGYADFFGFFVGARGLSTVMVNKDQAVEHLRTLANYQTGPDQELKLPSAFFALIIAEAERFYPLRQAVFDRWDGLKARTIDDPIGHNALLIDLVTNWRVFSCAILSWYKHGQTLTVWSDNLEAREMSQSFHVGSAQQSPIHDPSNPSASALEMQLDLEF